MSAERTVAVHGISWRDLCPWLVLFRAVNLSLSLPILVLATCATIITPLGWKLSATMFVSEAELHEDVALRDLVAANERNTIVGQPLESPVAVPWGYVRVVFDSYVAPYREFFTTSRLSFTKCAYLCCGTLWTLVTWGLAGGAINRIAVVRFGRGDRIGLRAALKFSISRLRSYVLAPLFPLAGVAMVLIPCALVGLAMRLEFVAYLAALAWPVMLLAGLVIVLLLLGALFGWPLMFGAISAEEGGDEFEALHRSFSYTFQRPFHYLFYMALIVVLGQVVGWFAQLFGQGVFHASLWATSWGAESSDLVFMRFGRSSAVPLNFWESKVSAVASGFVHAFFWCSAAAVYLLLRRDVDETEFDEVFFEDEIEKLVTPTASPAAADPAAAPTPPAESAPPSSEQAQG